MIGSTLSNGAAGAAPDTVAAIDFGGGYTKVAFVNCAGKPEPVRDRRGNKAFPTAVYVHEDGTRLVGSDALEEAVVDPSRLSRDFKRNLAQPDVISGVLRVEEAVAEILRECIRLVELQSGEKVNAVELTVPANFDDAQKRALVDCAESVGLRVIRMISEPTAAAFAAWGGKDRPKGEHHVLCVDIGSTTTDVSLLRFTATEAVPVATEGVRALGGTNITDLVLEMVFETASKELKRSVGPSDLSTLQSHDLWLRAESAKVTLGASSTATVAFPDGGRSVAVKLKRKEFESRLAKLLEPALHCIDAVLSAAGKKPQDLALVVAAGAPFYSEFVRELFEKQVGLPLRVEGDPQLLVVCGAAVDAVAQAVRCGMSPAYIPDCGLTLRESTAHDLGIAVVSPWGNSKAPVCAVVIPKGTRVPCVHERDFKLLHDAQTRAETQLVQGPDGTPADQCLANLCLTLSGLTPEPTRSARIHVRMECDESGLLAVTVTDRVSGQNQSGTLQTNTAGTGGQP